MLHNRKPNRMKGYDYSQDNLYFVTSCVENRVCCFGEITDGKMILNEYGKIAEQQWHWLGEQYPYIILHEFVVMPNHIHGIIEIKCTNVGTGRDPSNDNKNIITVGTGHDLSLQQNDLSDSIGTGRDPSLRETKPIKIKSLSELIGAYKTTTSKQIHLLGYNEFQWQRSFHDHIIRDEKSYETISNYILNNPAKWEQDKFYKL